MNSQPWGKFNSFLGTAKSIPVGSYRYEGHGKFLLLYSCNNCFVLPRPGCCCCALYSDLVYLYLLYKFYCFYIIICKRSRFITKFFSFISWTNILQSTLIKIHSCFQLTIIFVLTTPNHNINVQPQESCFFLYFIIIIPITCV